jgi:hypothetical protein
MSVVRPSPARSDSWSVRGLYRLGIRGVMRYSGAHEPVWLRARHPYSSSIRDHRVSGECR